MFRKSLKVFKYLFLICLLGISAFIFIPRTYNVPTFLPRTDIKYWDLQSGSRIGYILLKGNPEIKQSPIIYLHGGPGGRIHESTIKLLQPITNLGYDIYLYDQIGSGHSARLSNIQEYTVQRHKQDLVEIIELLQAKQVIIFAHSWGTLLATDYFSDHQSKVEKLIYSGPGPILPFNHQLRNISPPDSLNLIDPKFSNRQANQETYNLRSKFVYHWARLLGSKLASDKEADHFFTLLNAKLSKSTSCRGSKPISYHPGGGYYSHIMTVNSFNTVIDKRAKIRGNEVPLLILKGQCDNQKWGFTQEYLELFPKSELKIFESAGHSIEESRRSEYLDVIKNFLE